MKETNSMHNLMQHDPDIVTSVAQAGDLLATEATCAREASEPETGYSFMIRFRETLETIIR